MSGNAEGGSAVVHAVRGSAIAALAVVIVGGGIVHADPTVTLYGEQVPALELEPALGLDAAQRTDLEGIGARSVDVVHEHFALRPLVRATVQTTLWSNDRDAHAEGWTVETSVHRDLGRNLSLVLDASVSHAVGGLDRADGTYASVGIALVRRFHLAHGRLAWISLGVTQSSWFGGAPSQLPGGRVVGLHAGVTF